MTEHEQEVQRMMAEVCFMYENVVFTWL
jgi:hypothetical protein